MIIYKFNVLERLKNSGISTYKIRKDKVLSESTLQRLRQNQIVSIEIIDILCQLLNEKRPKNKLRSFLLCVTVFIVTCS